MYVILLSVCEAVFENMRFLPINGLILKRFKDIHANMNVMGQEIIMLFIFILMITCTCFILMECEFCICHESETHPMSESETPPMSETEEL